MSMYDRGVRRYSYTGLALALLQLSMALAAGFVDSKVPLYILSSVLQSIEASIIYCSTAWCCPTPLRTRSVVKVLRVVLALLRVVVMCIVYRFRSQ